MVKKGKSKKQIRGKRKRAIHAKTFSNSSTLNKTKVISITQIDYVIKEIEKDLANIKKTITNMGLLNTRTEIILQTATLSKLVKNVISKFNSLKELKNSIYNDIINGSFFDWDGFIKTVLKKASKHCYVSQKDRDKLEEFAKILQAPAFCDPLDYDAYLRWTVYSVNKEMRITSFIAEELRLQKEAFQKAVLDINEKAQMVKKSILSLKSLNISKIIKEANTLVTHIQTITKKKQLSDKDFDRIIDLINNTSFELRI